ncbi:MAG: serine/threonine protein kinase [Phycisphaerales bacterium]|nr:MAG: serine/threonine protein kinase [Phycisphaerales bacterium]
MGTVYEAQQDHPRRVVALKVIYGGDWSDQRDVELFRREAQSLALLNHPCVGAIYESGCTNDGWHYIAMELVRGVALTEYVARSAVCRDDRLRLFRRICLAVHHAHQRGVIHRDLKPSNILVDRAGRPKILDFGLARLTHRGAAPVADLTQVGQIRGTFAYMSPEQAGGDPADVDERTDVYALGVILYELLTGRRPYELTGRSVAHAIRTICDGEPARPGDVDEALRGDLETIILTAMHKSRNQRYPSAQALAEDVHRFLLRRPILARRVSPPPDPGAIRRRRRVGVLAGAVPLLALCALAVYQQRVESDTLRAERDAAVAARIAAEVRADAAWVQLQLDRATTGRSADGSSVSADSSAGQSAGAANQPVVPAY